MELVDTNNVNLDEIFKRDKFDIKDFEIKVSNAITENYTEIQAKLHPEWEQWEKDYKNIKDPLPLGSKRISNHSVPITSTQVDGIATRENDEIFGYNEPIQMFPLGDGKNDELAASNGNKLMRWDIESHEDLSTEIWHFIKGTCKLGLSFIYTSFEEEQEEVEEEIQVVNFEEQVIEFDEEVVNNLEANQIPYQIENRLIKKMKWKKYNPLSVNVDRTKVCWNIEAKSVEDAFNNGFIAIQIEKTLDEIYR
jgi:hypothetical protein